MVHRIYKDIVPHTNRHDLPRDLVLHESQAQVLRFIAEGCTFEDIKNPNSANIGSKLTDLINLVSSTMHILLRILATQDGMKELIHVFPISEYFFLLKSLLC
jgi:hypothetical protein